MAEKGVDFDSVRYMESPLSVAELKDLLRRAELKPIDAIRKNETAYCELVAGQDLSDARLIELMSEHPELIQRPIVVRGKKAVLARPIEKLKELDLL